MLSPLQLLVWCAALTYFGIFFAVPLRRQTILVEQLRFPSGTATARLIEVLHATRSNDDPALQSRWRALLSSFAASFAVSAAAFFVPALQKLRVASWVGIPALTRWHWTVRPTLSLVGQGMIMGGRPAFSMLGLGDVVVPGLFRAPPPRAAAARAAAPRDAALGDFPAPYFAAGVASYAAGLGATLAVMYAFDAAQPALLYLVPATLAAALATAALRGELRALVAFSEEEEDEEEDDGGAARAPAASKAD